MAKPTSTPVKRVMDSALVDLCRTMAPTQRLQASIQLAEVTCQFYEAGVQFRTRKREASNSGQQS